MSTPLLDDYPRPALAVDVAVLSVTPSVHHRGPTQLASELVTLVQQRTERPVGLVLPGRFVRERQTLAAAVNDVLTIKAGLTTDRSPALLTMLDDPDRDERGWIVSAAHAVVVPEGQTHGVRGTFASVGPDGRLASGERLLFDHEQVLVEAVRRLRERYERRPDPGRLLGERFTLAELRAVHEAVLGEPLRRDTFNRRMVDHLMEVTHGGASVTSPSGGRPARLYERRARRDLSPSEVRRTRLPRRAGKD